MRKGSISTLKSFKEIDFLHLLILNKIPDFRLDFSGQLFLRNQNIYYSSFFDNRDGMFFRLNF